MTCKSKAPITLTYDLDAAPAKVWRAMTIPEYVAQWLGTPANSDNDDTAEEGSFELRLISAEPATRVRYSIKDHEAVSTVTFQISENGNGGTTFHIVHERAMSAANSNGPRLRKAA